jgi:hypothetical protein
VGVVHIDRDHGRRLLDGAGADVTAPYRLPAGINDESNLAIYQVLDERWSALPIELVLVWFLESTSPELLPFLAELFGLNGPEFRGDGPPLKVLQQGVELKRLRGTPWAMREVLRRLAFGEVELVEKTARYCDGTLLCDGQWRAGADAHWAVFVVYVDFDMPPPLATLQQLWDAITSWKRQVCHFVLCIRVPEYMPAMYYERPTTITPPRLVEVTD